MINLAIFAILCIHAAGAYFAFCIWKEMENIRVVLERQSKLSASKPTVTTVSSKYSPATPIYAIWVCKGSRWELDAKSVPTGYAAGSPPSFSGSYENQKVKTECRRC